MAKEKETAKKESSKKETTKKTSTTAKSKSTSEVKAKTKENQADKVTSKTAKRGKLTPKTYYPKDTELSKWVVVDAKGQTLGRLSSQIAMMLMGKNKAAYTRFVDTGDYVIVVNAKEVVLTGKKLSDKTYYYHTNYPGGIKSFTAQNLMDNNPEELIKRAVYGMLPKGHMGRKWFKKLKVFAGAEHNHSAQKPVAVNLTAEGRA